jgi:hypothetical protein
MRTLRSTLTLTFVLAILPLRLACGDPSPLDVVQDDVKRALSKREAQEQRELYGAKWFVPGTNYTSLFMGKFGVKNLLEWIGKYPADYIGGKETLLHEREYVGCEKIYKDKFKREYALLILVPHPKYSTISELGLIKKFSALEPPKLPVSISEQVVLKNHADATIHFIQGGGISLLIKGNRGSLVNVYAPKAAKAGEVTDFIEQFDLNRLWRKLDS